MTPRLFADGHLAAIRAISISRHYRFGEVVLDGGDTLNRFALVEQGKFKVADPTTGERLLLATLRPCQFMGDLAFLNGGPQ